MGLSKANKGRFKEEGQHAPIASNRPKKTACPLNENPSPGPVRWVMLDALRGLALLWMVVFHFCFDLSYFGLIQADFYEDALWTTQRTLILGLFLLCAGAGQALAGAQGQSWRLFWRRWLQIAGAALLVSAASAVLFGDRFIYFGVLHGLALMLILVRLILPLRHGLWLLGVLALALPFWCAHPFFDAPFWQWTGLVTRKPLTEDYVPLLPWLGVMCWGAAAMYWVLEKRPAWLHAAGRPGWNWLAVPGCFSLAIYLLHQPVLMGILWLVQAAG